ncbi:MAG: hypothetical protein QME07_01020 [bacterium]|nr:hypothetical protein [bacterium]
MSIKKISIMSPDLSPDSTRFHTMGWKEWQWTKAIVWNILLSIEGEFKDMRVMVVKWVEKN